MEKQFAVKAVQHMVTYWKLLSAIPGSKLRLTRHDDAIMAHLHRDFPDFDPAATIDEDEMKSAAGKERWRNFVNQYEKGDLKVDGFNFGTLLRKRADMEYTEKDSIFVVRMQFLAIEIARNRAGLNDWVFDQAKKEKEREEEKKEEQKE